MAIIEGWLPPTREHWELIVSIFKYFPLVTVFQWIPLGQKIYSQGKTSIESRVNIPGKIAWITMEAPGFITLLYIMNTLPQTLGIEKLPWENWAMAGLFTFHYMYRAILSPLINPSMSPISPFVWCFALWFQLMNSISVGGWLGGYGFTTRTEWSSAYTNSYISGARMELGFMIFALGFILHVFHDDELREIRRASARNQRRRAKEAEESTGKGKAEGKVKVDKVYMIPKNGFFWWIFYPHYVAEWIQWSGFWLMGGSSFVPGRTFVINEIATMVPRAVQGRNWYIDRFGKENVDGRKAVIPGLL